MVKMVIPSAADIATKWAEEGPKRQPYYEKNAVGKGASMETNAIAAAGTFKSAMTAADIDKRFKGGLKGAGAKYDRKVKDVGVGRFGPGITAAKKDMEDGMTPVVADLASIDIDPRKPRGDPANLSGRSNKVASEMTKKRLARLAAGAG
jgi:cytochrome c551/c552